jgi:ribonuclease HII
MAPDPFALLFAELGRLSRLEILERELYARGYVRLAGVDEAGRGSLAGPVVAAAVVVPRDWVLPGLDDSKKLDGQTRQALDAEIRRRAVAVATGVVSASDIDVHDILRSSLRAMRLAIEALSVAPEAILIDAVRIPGVRLPQLPVVHGDALCASIAAASVVAKVFRDRLLDELARAHPVYGFDQHKGYGTPEHWQALRRFGPCPEHRLTYRGVVPDEAFASARERGEPPASRRRA